MLGMRSRSDRRLTEPLKKSASICLITGTTGRDLAGMKAPSSMDDGGLRVDDSNHGDSGIQAPIVNLESSIVNRAQTGIIAALRYTMPMTSSSPPKIRASQRYTSRS